MPGYTRSTAKPAGLVLDRLGCLAGAAVRGEEVEDLGFGECLVDPRTTFQL